MSLASAEDKLLVDLKALDGCKVEGETNSTIFKRWYMLQPSLRVLSNRMAATSNIFLSAYFEYVEYETHADRIYLYIKEQLSWMQNLHKETYCLMSLLCPYISEMWAYVSMKCREESI